MTTDLKRTPDFVDGEVSYWYRELGMPARRDALQGDTEVDVAIVGGGLTGLWTAYYLKTARSDLRIAVLERGQAIRRGPRNRVHGVNAEGDVWHGR